MFCCALRHRIATPVLTLRLFVCPYSQTKEQPPPPPPRMSDKEVVAAAILQQLSQPMTVDPHYLHDLYRYECYCAMYSIGS